MQKVCLNLYVAIISVSVTSSYTPRLKKRSYSLCSFLRIKKNLKKLAENLHVKKITSTFAPEIFKHNKQFN